MPRITTDVVNGWFILKDLDEGYIRMFKLSDILFVEKGKASLSIMLNGPDKTKITMEAIGESEATDVIRLILSGGDIAIGQSEDTQDNHGQSSPLDPV